MDGKRFRFLLLAQDDLQLVTDQAKTLDFKPHAIISSPRTRPIPIQVTPTLIITDNSGRVVKSWLGRQNAAGQQDVLRVLAQLNER